MNTVVALLSEKPTIWVGNIDKGREFKGMEERI